MAFTQLRSSYVAFVLASSYFLWLNSSINLAQALAPPSTSFSLNVRSGELILRPKPLHLQSKNNNGSASDKQPDVVCVGEALWDSLPSGIYLGGAPTNVAVHIASLFQSSASATTANVAVSACLGKDQLGKEAARRLALKGVMTDGYIQFHKEWETGMATALLDANGDATYSFNTPAAWDGLVLNEKLQKLIQSANTPVFVLGTIAGRLEDENGATSLSTLMTIRNASEGEIVLDVNLRSPWYTSARVLRLARGEGESAEGKSPKKLALLKFNEEELCLLEEWCGLQGPPDNNALSGVILKQRMEHLSKSLNTQRLCVTRGKDGAALLCNNVLYENSGYSAPSNGDSDSVGAGDAFLGALVSSLFVQNESPERALERACALGGYVASCRGATPEHGDAPEDLRRIFSESN